jgi:hypothetical protein
MGYGAPPYPVPAAPADSTAIAGLILGAISIPMAGLALCGTLFAVLGLIFSFQSRAAPRNHRIATIGVVLSIIGLALSTLPILSGIPFFMFGLFPH